MCADVRKEYRTTANTALAKRGVLTTLGNIGGAFVTVWLGEPLKNALADNFSETVDGLNGAIIDDADRLQRATKALDAVYDCRRTLASEVNEEYLSRQISRSDAQTRLDELRALTEDDLELARRVLSDVGERNAEFQVAVREVRRTARTPAQRKKVEETELALQTNQNAFEDSSAQVEEIEVASAGEDFELAIGKNQILIAGRL
ncbi:MAG: hypothetical protein AAF675_10505 [Pseudomonadota bacterium]